ncbi:hypothetical protein KI387_010975 [Taxus chinensis]|uniref:Protein kinase domain-containing protein n=1 Tax=Taxus chinensis TaxID=29808 RepID=A0AA38FM26_TAXCH|nr:hypothetical protein KI387_010975 [Taxus chinensis]
MEKPILIIAIVSFVLLNLSNLSHGDDDAEALLKLMESFEKRDDLQKLWKPSHKPCIGNDSQWSNNIKCLNGRVKALTLENMELGGTVDEEALQELTELRILSLRKCNLSGKFPDMSKLNKLKSVYLDGNMISGSIDDAIFQNMTALRLLRVSNNNLTGSIPSSLRDPTYLADVRMDMNHLEGSVPELKQTSLEVFNVSFNNLNGKIPDSMSQRFQKDSFLGNPNLCGNAVDKACKSKKKLKPWVIVVIVVADIGGLLILSLLFVYAYKKRKINVGMESNSVNRMNSFQTPKKVFPDETFVKGGVVESGSTENSSFVESTKSNNTTNIYNISDSKLVFFDGCNFELEELLRASAELMTKGNFGTVYRAIMDNGSVIVVKRLKEFCKFGEKEFDDYILFLSKLKHQNIVPLKAYYGKEDKLLLFDFMPNGNLLSLLHGNRGVNKVPGAIREPLDWKARLKIIVGVARGLSYLHKECSDIPIPHGHLKSSNILLDHNNEPRLCDYALQPLISAPAVNKMVAYNAPECLKNKLSIPSPKADVWSFGVLLLELLTGKSPSHSLPQGENPNPQAIDLPRYVNAVVREEWTGEVFDREISMTKYAEGEMLQILQIALSCTDASPGKRPDMAAVLKKIEQIGERAAELVSTESELDGASNSFYDYTGDFSFSVSVTPGPATFHTGAL